MKSCRGAVAVTAAALLASAAHTTVQAADLDFDPESGLTWTIGDGKNAPSLKLDGRFHGDYAEYSDDVTPLEDGFLLRRLRPALTFEWGDWKAKVDYEFNDRSQGVHTAYVEYDGFKRTVMRAGAQPLSFGLEASGSSNTNPFMERSLASSALAPGSMAGLSLRKWDKRWNFTVGAYGNDINDDEQRGLDGYGLVGRATGVPYKSDAMRMHVGVSLEFREATSNAELRYRTRPESNVDGTRLVDTGAIAGVNRLGHITRQGPGTARKYLVEAAWQGVYRSPAIRAYFERVLHGRHERRKIALVATAHYLLRCMHAMLVSGRPWHEAA